VNGAPRSRSWQANVDAVDPTRLVAGVWICSASADGFASALGDVTCTLVEFFENFFARASYRA
jgi:hypothetical protein